MKSWSTRILLTMFLTTALATAAWASPSDCVTGAYSLYQAHGSSGCTHGNELFGADIMAMMASNVDEPAFTYVNVPANGSSGNPSSMMIAILMNSAIPKANTAAVSAVKDTASGGPQGESSANVSGPITPITGATPLSVQDGISSQGQGGVAQQQDFANLFTADAVPAAATPESSPLLLIASGLACFGLTRKIHVRR